MDFSQENELAKEKFTEVGLFFIFGKTASQIQLKFLLFNN